MLKCMLNYPITLLITIYEHLKAFNELCQATSIFFYTYHTFDLVKRKSDKLLKSKSCF
jgi:hypothetical protein